MIRKIKVFLVEDEVIIRSGVKKVSTGNRKDMNLWVRQVTVNWHIL